MVGRWVVDFISFQKIFGLCGLECHILEIWRDVTLVDGQRTTEHEDRARILEAEFAIIKSTEGFELELIECGSASIQITLMKPFKNWVGVVHSDPAPVRTDHDINAHHCRQMSAAAGLPALCN